MMPGFSRNKRQGVFTLAAVMLTLIAFDVMAFPSARRQPGMVWSDEAKGAILFGGRSPADVADLRYEYGDTWRFSSSKWTRLYPENAPSPRYAMSMTYDSARDRVFLFGGAVGDEDFLGDTWIFRDGNWTQLDPPTAPPGRSLAGMAYDPVRDKVVLYGGSLLASRSFDTWEFDGTTWTLISSSGPNVENPTLVYDGARDEILMTGTEGTAVVMYRYDDGSWSRIQPETLPPCVVQSTMVYREWDGTVLTYGGSCAGGLISNDTWLWDGTDWTELETVRSAGPVFGHGMAHDTERNQTILYGGVTFGFGFTTLEESDRTYKLSGDRWVFVDNVDDPGSRTHFAFQPSLDNEHLLLFGGQDATDFKTDFWRLNNLHWERIPLAEPPNCTVPASARDTQRNRIVLLCSDASTWEYDGETFTEKTSTDNPTPRRWSMMAFDPISRKVIMYGGFDDFGEYYDETWAWDGTQWKKLDLKRDQKPPARILATMFLDPTTNRIIVAGGVGFPDLNSDFERYEDQWQFDGTKWAKMNPSQKLPQRYGAQVAVDPVENRVLVFGGKSSTEKYLNDMWAWNGTTWSEVNDGLAPSPRMNGRMAWDPSSGRIVLYGGFAGLYYPELWAFDGTWTLIEEDTSVTRRRRPSAPPATAGSAGAVDSQVDVSVPHTVTLPEALR